MDGREPSSVRRTSGARTGGRSHRVVTAVLRAAIEEIAANGYGGLRVEHVAERAGVNKTSVYRRWPTKAHLAGAAIRSFLGLEEALPDTGSVRTDLVEMVGRAIAVTSTPEGRAIMRLVTLESADPEVDALRISLRSAMMERRAAVLERAQHRGELPLGLDAKVLVDAIFMPIVTRVGRYHEVVDPATAEAFVDLALGGVQHAAARAHREAC